MKGILIALVCLGTLGSIGCTKAGKCNTLGLAFSIQDESAALGTAQQAYSADPSTKNCERYRKAYEDYLNALKKWEKCLETKEERDNWQQSIDQSQQDLQNLNC